MNSRIASLLKDRISEFTYVDKLAGLVRAVTYERAGESITIPVDIGVNDPLACGDAEISDLVPNEGYGCIVYFEDKGMRRVQSRTRGIEFESRMRLVCWVNTAKFNGDNTAGDRIMQQFLGVLQASSYNSGPFIGVRHSLEGMPERGKTLFAAYTYPEGSRQYLMWPFDAFGIDVVTTFRIKPGCEDEVQQGDAECWTPPANRRKRNPAEFSCDELNAPVTGLTDAQKECIDGGGGECDPLTWELRNSDEELLGSGSVTDPCGEALPITAPDGTQKLNGVVIGTPPSGGERDAECDDLVDAYGILGGNAPDFFVPGEELFGHPAWYTFSGSSLALAFSIVDAVWGIYDLLIDEFVALSIGGDQSSPAAAEWDMRSPPVQLTIADLCPCAECEDVTIIDQDDNPIDGVPEGGTYQVIVLSGIDGGASNSTYSNSIIQP